jgi:hypothetical protein
MPSRGHWHASIHPAKTIGVEEAPAPMFRNSPFAVGSRYLAAYRQPISRSCSVSIGCTWSIPRWFAYVARPAGFAGVQDRPPACEDVDAADGDRGALSPSAHH